MVACFVGSEAVAIHGMKNALRQTADIETVDINNLAETIRYQREHGFKLAWLVQTMADHKELWKAATL